MISEWGLALCRSSPPHGLLTHAVLHHQSCINALAFSPNGKYLASGSDDGNVVIWNLEAGKVLCELGQSHNSSIASQLTSNAVHSDPVVSLCWSKDSELLTSASMDGSLRISHVIPTRQNNMEYEMSEVGSISSRGINISEVNTNNLTSNSGCTLLHCSLTDDNYLVAVNALDVER